MAQNTLRIDEIFGPTIQGEGALIGQATVFVRAGGCDYRCSWCDTLHAVESQYRSNWKKMSALEIFTDIQRLSNNVPLMVTISGGNPAIQDFSDLITLGKAQGYKFAIETQGSVVQDWFADLDVLTLSPKPPSSAMDTDLGKLDACVKSAGEQTQIALKFPILDEEDYQYARQISARYTEIPVYLQPVNHTPPSGVSDGSEEPIDMDCIMARMRWLVDRAAQDQWFDAIILPQLHILLWGNQKGV